MTLKELTEAIRQHIDTEMDAEVASGMAEHALGFFGFYDRIIDNALEPTDRNLFICSKIMTYLPLKARRPLCGTEENGESLLEI